MKTTIPYVFHRKGPIRDLYKRWREATKAAKIPDRLIHDLRRTAVRNLERAGVPRFVAMKLTGHKTEAVYRRYAIVAKADLTEGVEKLARLHALLRGQVRGWVTSPAQVRGPRTGPLLPNLLN
jgi:integrase